jgi:hypothetical protein
MSQFFIPDASSKERCDDSRNARKPTSVSGVDAITGQLKAYTGVVQSVEDFGADAPAGKRWRVTMLPN